MKILNVARTGLVGLFAALALHCPHAAAAADLIPGLKAYWKLDEASGARFDSTTNHFDLSLFNNVSFDVAGKLNGAASISALSQDQGLFTGTNARAPLAFSGDWTVSVWAKHSATTRWTGDNIFAKPGELYFGTDNYGSSCPLRVLIYSGAPNYAPLLDHQFPYALPANQWHHLVLQRNQGSILLFVNGQLQETVPFTGTIQDGGWDFWIGMQKDGWPWNGSLDEVGYWGRSLSASEITALYGSGTPPAYETFGDVTTRLYINQQPLSQTASAGDSVSFSVVATGPSPLNYQWRVGGADISGETGSRLTLTNINTNHAGVYAVLVSSTNGSILSSNASLTVLPSNGLFRGLKGYWKLDETSSTRFDSTANHFDLSLFGNVSSATGKLNSAASISALSQDQGLFSAVNARAALTFSGDWTVSTWVKHSGTTRWTADHIFSKPGEVALYTDNSGGSSHLHVAVVSGGTALLDYQFAYMLPANQWHHIVLQRSSGSILLFVDGQLQETVPITGAVQNAGWDFWIGMQKDGWPWNGLIDEVGYWGRSLSAWEIAVLYGGGNPPRYETFGDSNTPPLWITQQPLSQTASAGGTATFSVVAVGPAPLTYQWRFGGTDITGETNSTLSLTNINTNQAGLYAVLVSNTNGSVLSSNATLTVYSGTTSGLLVGLKGYWKLDESSSTRFDSTANHFDLSLFNNVSFDASGKLNGAALFSAMSQDQGLFTPANARAALTFSNDWTVATWVRHSTTTRWTSDVIFSKPQELYLGTDNASGSSHLHVLILNGTPSTTLLDHQFAYMLPANQWHHIVLQRSVDSILLFVDGQLQETVPISGTIQNGGWDFWIGMQKDGWPWNGSIDELGYWGRGLSTSEIAALYGNGTPPPYETFSGTNTAPIITSQPQNASVIAGANVMFNVSAMGQAPLSYQWYWNGDPISGATTSSIGITNVQASNTGGYSAVVTNEYGTATSSTAVLSVTVPAFSCVDDFEPGVDLLQWSAFGGLTLATNYGGSISGSKSLWFGGSGSRFATTRLLDTSAGATASFYLRIANGASSTWEMADLPGEGIVFEYSIDRGTNWANIGTYNTSTYFSWTLIQPVIPSGALSAGTLFRWRQLSNSGASNDHWALEDVQIIATPYEPVIMTQPQSQTVIAGSNATLSVFAVGRQPLTYQWFNGASPIPGATGSALQLTAVDEALAGTYSVAITNAYGSVASSNAVLTIVRGPSISTQPVGGSVPIGATFQFVGSATGTAPLSYQWQFNGANLAGATSPVLTLLVCQPANAGLYRLIVSNAWGSAVSSNVALAVLQPIVQVPSCSGAAGNQLSVPVILTAIGNENAAGFSLNYDPSLLTFEAAILGTGASGATLFVNTNQTGLGRLGLALALPWGAAFAAGTQEVISVRFATALVTNTVVTPVTFGNQPTPRQMSDAQAHAVSALFNGGVVSISAVGLEADVAPRPTGDNFVGITDWVQVGRFVAGLDTVDSPDEFQRADCAPRSNAGNGQLTVADWVQAGRYAAGLDPLKAAGGPTGDIELLTRSSRTVATIAANPRSLNLKVTGCHAGTNECSVELWGQGNENAAGFTVSFDPTVLRWSNASLGSGASGAALNVNTNDIGSGRVGLALALPTGSTFASGTNELVRLSFVSRLYSTNQTALAFSSVPVALEVVDPNANVLSSDFSGADYNIPGLQIPGVDFSRTSTNVTLSWPAAVTGSLVEFAPVLATNWSIISPLLVTNGANVYITIPLTNGQGFFRLRLP